MKRRAFATALALTAGNVAAGRFDVERLVALFDQAKVDGRAIDDLEALTDDLMRREATVSPAALYPQVRGHLEGLRDLLVWTPSHLGSRTFSMAGQAALLAGYLMFKQERNADADAYWSLAERFGEAAGDTRLRAGVLVLKGWRWKDEDLTLSLEMLDHAASVLGPAPDPVAAAQVLCMRGRRRAEAHKGDSSLASLALRDVEQGHAHLSRVQKNDGRFYVFESVAGEATELHALTLKDVGRPREAAAKLETLLASIDANAFSWRSYVTNTLAIMRAEAQEPESACELLGDACALAARASASRCIREIHATRHRHPLLTDYRGPAANRLDDELPTYAAVGRLP